MKEHILLVDDENDITNLLQFALTTEGFEVSTASDGKEALDLLQTQTFDLLLTDMKMPIMDGLELLRHLRKENSDVEAIVLTGHASLELAIDVIRNGMAFDFFQKPLEDIDHLIVAINRALERRRLKKDQKRMQAELEASERFNQAVIDSLPSHILVLDEKEGIKKTNRSWKQFASTHFEASSVPRIGDAYPICCGKAGSPEAGEVETGIQRLLRGEIRYFQKECVCTLSKPEKCFLIQATRLKDSDGQVVISETDITMMKAMEAELINARKMEVIMTLTSGIAHEYNNALNVINGAAEMLKLDSSSEDFGTELIDMIIETGQRMNVYTQRLIAYAESGFYEDEIISPIPLIKMALKSIKDTLKLPLEVKLDLPDDVQLLKGDQSKLQTVFYEIILNAVEATEGVGNVSVSSERIWVEKPPSESPTQNPGDHIVISVKDNGVGIEDKIKSRIFDPFFTTKFIGRGLGLPAAYGIVRSHGGWIHADSEIGKGTEIKVFLPVYEKAMAEKRDGSDGGSGEKTVLIIEDNELNMELAEEIFKNMGFLVLKAENGTRAIDIAENYEKKIGLAFLDMMLPDMGGEDVYPRITAARPDMNVLICSGYSKQEAMEKIHMMGVVDFIEKPINFKKLRLKLREWFEID